MSKMISVIQKLFPMSKGALLAVSFLSFAGVYQFAHTDASMDEIKDLQRETLEEIHAIDKRLTVVEARLDGTIVFRSQPHDVSYMYSNPEEVDF